jgi:hypothetical protein
MNTYTMKEIKARDGYYLTQLNEVEDRIFITAIKGVNVNESDWREATEEEKNAYEEAQAANEINTKEAM